MSKEAFIFPGQGSQYEGMGKKLLNHADSEVSREASRTYKEGSDILGFDLSYLCTIATMEQLSRTSFTQPAIFATSIAYLRILNSKGLKPDVVAGHSAGEYAALVAAGALEFKSGIWLIFERGKAMEYAGKKNPGKMLAVLSLDLEQVYEVCRNCQTEPANFNEPKQTVIAGSPDHIEAAIEQIKKMGGKSIMLPVEIASHCSLMLPAKRIMQPLIEQSPISLPRTPFIQNWTGDYSDTVEQIERGLVYQIINPVRWDQTTQRMVTDEVKRFTEVGPGKVLTRINRKVNPEVISQSAEEVIFKTS